MKKLIFGLLFLFGATNLIAQSAEIQDVRKREFRGVKPIINQVDNSIEGYYAFYVNEKVGGGMVNFVLSIFDPQLMKRN